MVHCAYAFALAFSSVYMAIATPHSELHFVKMLDDSQKKTYSRIREERLRIYLKSLFVSLLIASVYYNKIKKDWCYFLSITLTLTPLFYMIHPKQQRMIDFLDVPEQYKALDDLRIKQKSNGVTSTLVGLSIWGIVALAPRCKSK